MAFRTLVMDCDSPVGLLACLLDDHSLFYSADHRPPKKARLASAISDRDHTMCDVLWHTFWGKSASECLLKSLLISRFEDVGNAN